MPNHLADETSPYLLQHVDNPVDWYPWGEAALGRAKEENRPILLSIGYAACHWCHVMAHESFEDETTAALMNQYFVNIKVDREERPDLDQIYMSAVQAMTGQGGWPMTVFLTPDGEPFYGGTYYPPVPRFQMPSFSQVLNGVANSWQQRQDEILASAAKMSAHIENEFDLKNQNYVLDPLLLERAVSQFATSFDAANGGFGGAPKFPPSMGLEFLLRMAKNGDATARDMAEVTLTKMAEGGIYDHIGGGFARYSVDARWLVPHFEKMLYDNAQLARVYLHAYQLTKNAAYRRVVEETLDWVLGEMTDEAGGFYSSYDADSEGIEGKFYVWSEAEIDTILGEDSGLFKARYDISAEGNFEQANIPNTLKSELEALALQFGLSSAEIESKLSAARQKLHAVRAERIWPGLDDKVLTAWNGLMLAAFAEAGQVLKRADYMAAAVKNGHFLQATMRSDDGRLLRTWKSGSAAKLNAYLEDYAYLADGLLALYQATFDVRWFVWAQELAELMLAQFVDENGGGFYDTSADHEALIVRPKNVQDNAVPSANAMACRLLILLSLFTGEGRYADVAEEAISALYPAMAQYPTGFGQWLGCAWLLLNEPQEVAIVGEAGVDALVEVVLADFRPNLVLAVGEDAWVPLLANRPKIDGRATAYVCQRFVCQQPVTDAAALSEQLG